MTTWRYLSDDGAGAADGLATDEALMSSHRREGPAAAGEATLRLYTYRPHCALVGRYQNLDAEVDLDACRARDVQIGRRHTGGGAIIMGPDQLGVAVVARADAERSPRELLGRYAEGVIAGLGRLGVEATFRSKNDLEASGRKIAGLGLYLDPHGAVLFHSSVLVDLDVALMLEVLRIPGAKLSDKLHLRPSGATHSRPSGATLVQQVSERVTTVRRELGRNVGTDEVREAIRDGFAEAFGIDLEASMPDAADGRRRDRLTRERYGNDAWIHQRSPRRDARGTALLKTPEGLIRVYVATHGEVIKSALVTGDFNVLPPAIATLEASLRWCRAEPDRIRELTSQAFSSDELGVPASTIADAVWEATENALELQSSGHPLRLEGSCYFPEPGTPESGTGQDSMIPVTDGETT